MARCAPHSWTVKGYARILGQRRIVESAEMLEKITREGLPAEIWAEGSLKSELEYGNHTSALKHAGEVLKIAVTDVAMCRTIVFLVAQAQETRGLRIKKLRVIHDLTFGGRERRGAGRQGALSEPEGLSVNADPY